MGFASIIMKTQTVSVYVMDDDGYCVKCGHYNEVPYTCTECECDCHD